LEFISNFKDMTAEELIEGTIILIDKPLNWTSFDVVNKIRWEIKKRFKIKKLKVGHAGTLDPLATGLLLICTGKKTKEIEKLQNSDKEYIAVIEFGHTTPSYDLETNFDNTYPYDHITKKLLEETLKNFHGEITQFPPMYSAKLVNGKRAYLFAHKGKQVQMNPHVVNIKELEILSFELPQLTLRIKCSKGTYIRSLANDIGKALASGAYLKSLRRTTSGNYSINNAKSIEQFIEDLLTLQPKNLA